MPKKASRRPRAAKKSAAKPRNPLRNDAIPRSFLGRELQRRLRKLGLTQQLAARIVDDAPSQISRLMTDHFEEFSADRMVKMLLALGSDVTITVRHSAGLGRRGKMRTKVG